MAEALDPFTKLYRSIEKEFERSGVKLVSWDSSRNPLPDVSQESDFPETQIRPSNWQTNLGNSSCGTQVIRNFDILVRTGDKRLGQMSFPTEWKFLGIFSRLKYIVLEELKYNDRPYVVTVDIQNAQSGLTELESRKIEGWSTVWTIRVELDFANQDLQNV